LAKQSVLEKLVKHQRFSMEGMVIFKRHYNHHKGFRQLNKGSTP